MAENTEDVDTIEGMAATREIQQEETKEVNEDAVIYWNPGTGMVAELASGSNATATSSNARVATASNARPGNDKADGKTVKTPVRTLEAALKRAEELQEKLDIPASEITICAMNPMEVADGELYILNAGNLRIVSWGGRSYDNDTIFYLNGGQLSLLNIRLEGSEAGTDPEKTELVYVRGGALQMGQNVVIDGRVILDYQDETVNNVWELASDSDLASKSNAKRSSNRKFDRAEDGEGAAFDIDEYILSDDEDSLELITEELNESTWRLPVIELLEGSINSAEQYLLEVRGDDVTDDVILVQSLYADDSSEAEFMERFALSESTDSIWRLQSESRIPEETDDKQWVPYSGLMSRFSAILDTTYDEPSDENSMTRKVLKATKGVTIQSDNIVYWNPGPDITVSEKVYLAGEDENRSGYDLVYPVKTWKKAVEQANGGIIVCMQTLNLGAGAEEYIGVSQDGDHKVYEISSPSEETMVTLRVWMTKPVPAFKVGSGKTLILKNINLQGYADAQGTVFNSKAVLCDGGDIIIDENVTAESGIIQINVFDKIEEHPVVVNYCDDYDNGNISVFFGGINDNLSYRYKNVIVPGESLKDYAESGGETTQKEVGERLSERFDLDRDNTLIGGLSRFDWKLRPDTIEDGAPVEPQKLELYTEYYFDAIYLDGVRGDDSYYGATCQFPVKTWAEAEKIWKREMQKSLDARAAAEGLGIGDTVAKELYPVPTTIYICGPVEVKTAETWDLGAVKSDAYGNEIRTEVVSHTHIPNQEGSVNLSHELPDTLVTVKSGGDLTLENITIRNITNESDSVTIEVLEGGALTLNNLAVLTGQRLAVNGDTAMASTRGRHIAVDNGTLQINNGALVTRREQGVSASGGKAVVSMSGGAVSENIFLEESFMGAGVALLEGASFTMNGGEISKNGVKVSGGGVYLADDGTSFTMNKGTIADNYAVDKTTELRYGMGIYAGLGTNLDIGSGSVNDTDVIISGNNAYYVQGGGIYSNGVIKLGKATIKENFCGGLSNTGCSYGIGIFVGSNSTFSMEDTVVTGNYSIKRNNQAANTRGAGIYFAEGPNTNIIKNAAITNNKIAGGSWGHGRGGGIYSHGSLVIEGSEISGNHATYESGFGGGIYMTASNNRAADLQITGSVIENNYGQVSGGGIYIVDSGKSASLTITDTTLQGNNGGNNGGAIYASGNATSIVLNENTHIVKNWAQNGGGIRLNSAGVTLTVNAQQSGDVTISNNTSTSEGGGISNAGKVYADLIKMEGNTGGTGGAIRNAGTIYMTEALLNNNQGGSGAAIYTSGGSVFGKGLTITNNNASANGGAVYAGGGNIFFRDVLIQNNKATSDGGGIYVTAGNTYLTDTKLTNNTAGVNGGGIRMSGTGKLYLSETDDGKAEFTANSASRGGGIYSSGGYFVLDLAGEIKNTATENGSNLYQTGAGNMILNGHFAQEDTEPGNYNFYVSVTTTSAQTPALYLDMKRIKTDAKTTGDPDVIFLDNASSYLTYLSLPPDLEEVFPIDLNKEEFKVGTVVVKPVGSMSVSNYLVKEEPKNGTEPYTEYYGPVTDATINMSYSEGGNMPRRLQFGGYYDSFQKNNINIVLVGEGVYLSTVTGKDDDPYYDGSSPLKAVATFENAKDILQQRIGKRAEAESGMDPETENVMGYSPIIYICGTVTVQAGEIDPERNNTVWELDYRDSLFTDTNKNYAVAEARDNQIPYQWTEEHGDDPDEYPAYPAQVQRFASFITEPMIEVQAGANLELGTVIINGMGEAVIYSDQKENSPVIKSSSGSQEGQKSSVTLNGNTEITNNYFSGLNISGALYLKGEAEDKNRQLVNMNGYPVILSGSSCSVEMSGHSRILAENGDFGAVSGTRYGIYSTSSPGAVITMMDDSAIEVLPQGKAMAWGMVLGGGGVIIKMLDNARIENLPGGIYLNGNNNNVTMKDYSSINVLNDRGIHYKGSNTKTLIDNHAKIVSQSSTGITFDNSTNQLTVQEDASVTSKSNSAITCGSGTTKSGTVIRIKDRAVISAGQYGIQSEHSGTRIYLQDFVKVNAGNWGVVMHGPNQILSVNREEADETIGVDAAADGDSVEILAKNGVYSNKAGNQILLGKDALIKAATNKGGNGIQFANATSAAQVKLSLQENSQITGFNYGITGENQAYYPILIQMEQAASINNNNYGIVEATGYYGLKNFTLEMTDTAKISENVHDGINLNGHRWAPNSQNIRLREDASLANNGRYAITTTGPVQVELFDRTKITGSGQAAVYLTYVNNKDSYRSGTATVTLNDSSSICDNNSYGVYAELGNVAENRPNPCIITLKDNSSIVRNKDSVNLMEYDQVIKLQDNAVIGERTEGDTCSLVNYGSLELAGTSVIEGRIYQNTGSNPITLTSAIEDPEKEFSLWLAEGYLGQIVVKPDGTGLTDAAPEIGHFKKAGADGMAADKNLYESGINIVLEGINDVYLAGNGNDNNNGNSPSTPVRTFKRAKELLETGEYSKGANIKICNTTVVVVERDSNWSFGEDGTVSNPNSGDTWTPLLIRYENWGGVLVQIDKNNTKLGETAASEVEFSNVIIDGNSENMTLSNSRYDNLLSIENSSKAILKEGAVLQNNRSVSTAVYSDSVSGVSVNKQGILEMDGGMIRNVVREATVGNSTTWPASAVLLQNGSKFIMKSGQITENQLLLTNSTHAGLTPAAIVINGKDSQMEMSGGIIDNNITAVSGTSKRGSTILNVNGNLLISGGTIRDNQGGQGSAIWYSDGNSTGSTILSGGLITGNKTLLNGRKSEGDCSPVFVTGNNFQLKGGGADIRDNIYLNSINYIIKVSGDIDQQDRLYNIFLNQGSTADQFKKRSTVVQPDGLWVTDVTPYLAYFQVHSNPYILDRGSSEATSTGNVKAKENKCLLLMKAVYLDSEIETPGDGSAPSKAFKTFEAARADGAIGDGDTDYYVIYISGKAIPTIGKSAWDLPAAAYMCRYTGFMIYNKDGSEVPEEEREAYYGYLIEPEEDFVLDGISIYGRRSIDTIVNSGDSIINVNDGINVTIQQNGDRSTAIGRNFNVGGYISGGALETLGAKGGTVRVNPGGVLEISGGTLLDSYASYGHTIYLGADSIDKEKTGRLYLKNSPSIDGNVYLDGTGTETAAYIEPDSTYRPASPLGIVVKNDFTTRPVIKYPNGVLPGTKELEYFNFDDALKALYEIVNGDSQNVLELYMRSVIYLDGQNGRDRAAGGDGTTPQTAFRTLRQVYEAIGNDPANKGILVYIVDTVEIPAGTTIILNNILISNKSGTNYYKGFYGESGRLKDIEITGQVYFKRYAKPQEYDGSELYNGYNKATNKASLFQINNGGELMLNGIYIDGHSENSYSSDKTVVADGVEALSPLVTVRDGGVLRAGVADKDVLQINDGLSTNTLFANNTNINQKTNEIGKLKGNSIIEGSGAGVELLGGGIDAKQGGKAYLTGTEFRNMKLGANVVSGGTDVYSYGDLHVTQKTKFGGSVFLEGFGDSQNLAATFDTSHYISIDDYGFPVDANFQVAMRDAYNTRIVVHYPITDPEKIKIESEISFYLLENRVKDYFFLSQKEEAKYILELTVPVAVYIDGTSGKGDDSPEDRVAGSTPEQPVETLQRAYELLKYRGGNTIYVVGTIQIRETETSLTGTAYNASGGAQVLLGSTDKVKIVRYIQPDFAAENQTAAELAGYNVPDFTGALIHVNQNAGLKLGKNVFVDGHSEPTTSNDYTEKEYVNHSSTAAAPLITVAEGGTLNLLDGSTLRNNDNSYDDEKTNDGINGGAIANSGTTLANGVLFTNNRALKGSAAYQDGVFTIQSAPENLNKHSFYLTAVNTGTDKDPVWADRVIQTEVMIPDDQTFDVDMDHAVKGRDVVKFLTDDDTFHADPEHEHFIMGITVPKNLFLVEDVQNKNVLELQNWEVLNVEVPKDIYLVVQKRSYLGDGSRLMAVDSTAAEGDLLTAPQYTIKNNGMYDVKVSVSGFENRNNDAGITHDVMNLKGSAGEAAGSTSMYLALKGLDQNAENGFTMKETALQPYSAATVTAPPAELGVLKAKADNTDAAAEGHFTFVGAVDAEFVDKYLDSTFPLTGRSRAEVEQYMAADRDSNGNMIKGTANARALYQMRFKLELQPVGREGQGELVPENKPTP